MASPLAEASVPRIPARAESSSASPKAPVAHPAAAKLDPAKAGRIEDILRTLKTATDEEKRQGLHGSDLRHWRKGVVRELYRQTFGTEPSESQLRSKKFIGTVQEIARALKARGDIDISRVEMPEFFARCVR